MIHTLFLIVIYLLFCMLLGIRMVLIYECDTFIFFSRPQINYANLDLRQFTLCSSVSVWQWVIGFFSYYWMHRCNIIFESKVHWNLESWKVDIYKLGTCIDFTSHNACKPKNLILKCICYYWIFRSSIPRPFYFTHSGVVKRNRSRTTCSSWTICSFFP